MNLQFVKDRFTLNSNLVQLLATILLSAVLFTLSTNNINAQVKAWGNNASGQLGNGTTTQQYTRVTLSNSNNITAISTNKNHTLALKADGTLLAWGDNSYGKLGNGNTIDRSTPVAVTVLTDVVEIATGERHSLALKRDGTVWVWGNNQYGQLGRVTTDTDDHPTPLQVPNLSGVTSIAAHLYQSFALKSDGTVRAWGYNGNGQLGNNTATQQNSPVQVSNLTNVVQIAAGNNHTVALKRDGTVWAWGYNGYGQLGNNSTFQSLVPRQSQISGVAQISAGFLHTVALKPDGTVFVWGNSEWGQVGNGTTSFNVLLPAQTTISNVIEVKSRGYHNLARLKDGSIRAWGNNEFGQIGNGNIDNQSLPVQPTGTGTGNTFIEAGFYHSFSALSAPITPSGTNVFLRGANASVTFDSVQTAGTTTFTAIDPSSTGLTVPSGFTIVANSPAYNITTTAATTANSLIVTCLNVKTISDETTFNRLHILHGEGSELVDQTYSLNYAKREICARTTSLSPFVLATTLAPTAATVVVSGRVMNGKRAVANASVSLTTASGAVRTARTNSFGYYRFEEIEAGQTITIEVSAKRFWFMPQVMNVSENLTVDFTAQ